MSKRIAVIGGSGFIGSRLVQRLLHAGHEVRIADKAKSSAFPNLWVECDVRDARSLVSACSGCDTIYNLAAEHRDDVKPISLYDEVNVDGAANTISAASDLGIQRIIFTSSVAIYGFVDHEIDESGSPAPFNDYGRTKLEAEMKFMAWQEASESNSLTIVRPTVVFGEDNRGNVYNLLRQIANGPFLMIGNGQNQKSMAYVENVAAFLEFALEFDTGMHLYNYIDKPDFDMDTLVSTIRRATNKSETIHFRIPYPLGMSLGYVADILAVLTRKPLPFSRIRVKKFCSTTQFSAKKALSTGFSPPVPLPKALERTIRAEFEAHSSEMP